MRLQKTNHVPQQINCLDKQDNKIAVVYCDQCIRVTDYELSIVELTQLKVIAENFKLFYDNLGITLYEG